MGISIFLKPIILTFVEKTGIAIGKGTSEVVSNSIKL